MNESPKMWVKWLPLAEMWYNSSFHSTIQCSPFKALYGVDPSFGIVPVLQDAANPDAITTLAERQLFIDFLKTKLAQAQNRMKIYAD